jgi:SSS family solute:Na+ symporter
MQLLDLIVFIVYLAGITLFGSSFFKKNKTASAFTLGNSAIPQWVITMSIFATFVSSISFLALPGKAYQSDWNPFVFSLSLPIASIIAIKFFVPLYRKVNSASAYTFLEQTYGPWARVYASVCYLLTQLMRVGTILYLLAIALNAVFKWDIATIIIITGLVVLVYSVLGGLQAVVWTDAIQGIILITGALTCAVYIIFKMPEGLGQLFTIAIENHKFSLGSYDANLTQSTFWVVLVYGVFINLQNFGIDQNYIQRYMASKSEEDARKSALLGGLLYIPVSLVFVFIGTALFSFYTSGAAELPVELTNPGKSDLIFPYFIVHELPPGISGLLIASILAAGMSTISTSFNSAATVFLTDYYQRCFKKSSSEKDSMKVLYISSVIIGILGIAIGVTMINVKSALDAWWKLASIFSGGMLGLFLLAAFSKVKSQTGAIIGVVIGVLVIFWLSASSLIFGDVPGSHVHGYLSIVFGTATIFLVGFIFSLLLSKKQKNAG